MKPRNPSDPTPAEREAHYATHRPFRPWCPICVKARGREDPHYAKVRKEKDEGLPTVSIDYASLGTEEDEERGGVGILVGRDKWTQLTFCFYVECKGTGDKHIVNRVARSVGESGNVKAILKGDGEPALIQVQEAVKEARTQETVVKNPPAYDPQSNGAAERAVQEVKGQIRSLKLGLEARIGRRIKSEEPIIGWMVTHAAGVINRFLVGADGRTPYYRTYGKQFIAKTFELGEQVWAKPKRKVKTTRKSALAARWLDGTWVGYDHRSNEHLIILASGGPAIRVRTVKPRPDSERWSSKAIDEIKATMNKPNPKDESQGEPQAERQTQGVDFGMSGADLPEPPVQEREIITRDFKITEKIRKKYGYSDDCPGCESKRRGLPQRSHSQQCRERFERAMKEDEEDKITIEKRDRKAFTHPVGQDQQGEKKEEKVEEEAEGAPDDEDLQEEVSDVIIEEARDAADQPEQADNMDDEPNDVPLRDPPGDQRDDQEDPADPGEEIQAGPSKRRRLQELESCEGYLNRHQRIEQSLHHVLGAMIRDGHSDIGKLCSRDMLKSIIDDLDKQGCRKVQRRLRRAGQLQGEPACDVAEAYSRPRMTDMAKKLGYSEGFALDLRTSAEDGEPWDLSQKHIQQKALELQAKMAPYLLIVSPPCTWFSTLQAWNVGKMEAGKVSEEVKNAMNHLAFAVILCTRQAQAGRKFLFEHPAAASSWTTGIMNKLFQHRDAQNVNFDFCMMGMKSSDEEGEAPARKRTGALTNSKAIAEMLRQAQCEGSHRHVKLIGGKAKACEEYPEEFCEKVCKAAMKEKMDAEGHTKFLNLVGMKIAKCEEATTLIQQLTAHPHVDEGHTEENLYNDFEFVDDVTGGRLDQKLAMKARKLEMDFFRRMKVYTKVSRLSAAGCKIITTRWLDINKGDATRPDYRSRLVGRELNLDKRLDLFAATPPLESLRMICSICASNQNRKDPFRMLSIDVKRAYFYAKAKRSVYIEIPIEDWEPGDEGRVGKLELSLYGTRDAAQNWATEYTNTLKQLGFKAGAASPCNFKHTVRELYVTVHGDDFTITGPTADLEWMDKAMGDKYDIKSEYLGPEAGMKSEIKILNRTLTWAKGEICYEADQRHADIVIKELGLEGARTLSTPGVPETAEDLRAREKSSKLSPRDSTLYRGIAARMNYLSLDRSDIQYATKSISRYMSEPRDYDWIAVKRLGRYLKGAPRMIQHFEFQDMPGKVTTYTDSDWAGDKVSRKSTSGGVIMLGKHVVKTWSSSQQVIALSSGEAELYALLKGAAQTKGTMSYLKDWDLHIEGLVRTDASAAIGIVHRQGLGKTRHIDVQYLWIQSEIQDKKLTVTKVGTSENPADLLTKFLKAETVEKHIKYMYLEVTDKRAKSALKIQNINFEGDQWKLDAHGWTRFHRKSRCCLFTPMKVPGGPTNHKDVGEFRITPGKFLSGEPFNHIDKWRTTSEPHANLGEAWSGHTKFVHDLSSWCTVLDGQDVKHIVAEGGC